MSRLNDHHFTMPDAPVFGMEDPFFDEADEAVAAAHLERDAWRDIEARWATEDSERNH